MPVTEAVWPVTALYFGPAAVGAYRRFGQPTSDKWLTEHQRDEPPDKPGWATVAVGVSHCGVGCTLGDIAAEFAVFGLGLTVAGTALPFEYVGDYVLAVALGIVFQYLAIAPMRGLGLRDGLKAAAKADVLSLTAFEVGLFGWMALTRHQGSDVSLNRRQPTAPISCILWSVFDVSPTSFPCAWWRALRDRPVLGVDSAAGVGASQPVGQPAGSASTAMRVIRTASAP